MNTHLPDHFKCPISLEIMSDPVILSSGHTFDRSSIQRWLHDGHRTCPITKLPLPHHPSLIPNHALRSLIAAFSLPDSKTPPEACALISTLVSSSSTVSSKAQSLRLLRRFSARDSAFRRCISDSGVVSAVLACVDSNDSSLQESALSLLLTLSLDDDNKVGLVAEGAIHRLVPLLLLREAVPDCRAVAATVLTSLAVVEVNKATIGAYPNAIVALVSVLRDGKGVRERKEAATALYTICSFPENRRRAVKCGAVPVLLRNVGSGLERGVEEMESYDGCVQILVHVLRNGSCRGIQYALLALTSLCTNSEEMVMVVLEEGVLEICVGLMENDNEKVRRNTSNLIQVLRGNHHWIGL
ncbi:putative aminoacyltransferase, E1 ubiquitin-activating enzyme [Lupinus albus]|uniref:RING-type E3 ubiquitin transferase n=1 Tax=Lupinus albus TaxID=3870 RepID=A0A6A4QH84_LUPAL|nr:putative aminoacyltransferase, E1 ubiquitin-activating enzyme [Lupinus albus]